MNDIWKSIFEQFNYSPNILSKFIRIYWTATEEKPGKNIYKKFLTKFGLDDDIISISKEILEYSKIYNKIHSENKDQDYWGGEKYGKRIIEVMNNLNSLDIQSADIIMMEIRSSFKDYFNNKGEFMNKIVDFFEDIEKICFLHISLFGRYPQKLIDKFSNYAINLKKSNVKRKQVFDQIQKKLKDEIKEEYLSGNYLEEQISLRSKSLNERFNNQEIKYILYKILKYTTKTDLIKIQINSFNGDSIEHIMPRSIDNWEADLKESIKEWSDSEYLQFNLQEKIKRYHKIFLNDLGNLSLLTKIQNTILGDKNFSDKKRILLEKERDNRLFDNVLSKEKWGHSEIMSRRREFCGILKKILSPK